MQRPSSPVSPPSSRPSPRQGGVMEEACGDQRGEGCEDGRETGEEGRCIHENIPSIAPTERQREKAEAEARGGGLKPTLRLDVGIRFAFPARGIAARGRQGARGRRGAKRIKSFCFFSFRKRRLPRFLEAPPGGSGAARSSTNPSPAPAGIAPGANIDCILCVWRKGARGPYAGWFQRWKRSNPCPFRETIRPGRPC